MTRPDQTSSVSHLRMVDQLAITIIEMQMEPLHAKYFIHAPKIRPCCRKRSSIRCRTTID